MMRNYLVLENIIIKDHIHIMVVTLLMQLVMLHRGNYHKVLQFCLTTTILMKKYLLGDV